MLNNLCLYKLFISYHHYALCSNRIGFLVSHHKRTNTTPQAPFDAIVDLRMNTSHADSNWRSNFSFSSKWSRWIITSALQKLAFILSNDQIYVEAISLLFYRNSIKNHVRGARILWFQLLWLDVLNTVITLNPFVCGWMMDGMYIQLLLSYHTTVQFLNQWTR